MKTGISTASLFGRYYSEEALEFFDQNGVDTAEVFLESFTEYDPAFSSVLNAKKGKVDVHSVHTLTTQFEPQLYSLNDRAKEDSFALLEKTMTTAENIGAKYYTFHGQARIKKTPIKIDFDRTGKITNDIIEVCSRHKVKLAYENVHWSYYNYIGFFNELRKRTNGLKATLDIKQARQSDIFYGEFIKEMKGDIVTVHLSDINSDGKMCLPGKGVTDFDDLFRRLYGEGFDGAFIIECYKNDFDKTSELLESLDFINSLKDKIFK